MVLDYISGALRCAVVRKDVSSVGFKGIVKKNIDFNACGLHIVLDAHVLNSTPVLAVSSDNVF